MPPVYDEEVNVGAAEFQTRVIGELQRLSERFGIVLAVEPHCGDGRALGEDYYRCFLRGAANDDVLVFVYADGADFQWGSVQGRHERWDYASLDELERALIRDLESCMNRWQIRS